jgi:hypothetical protein
MVTADEWLDVHNQHTAEEDAYREATDEHDLTDVTKQRADDVAAVTEQDAVEVAETAVPDVRDVAAEEPAVQHAEEDRVPSAAESAAEVDRAQRALREVEARVLADSRRAAEEAQVSEMYRRHTVDTAETATNVDDDVAVR